MPQPITITKVRMQHRRRRDGGYSSRPTGQRRVARKEARKVVNRMTQTKNHDGWLDQNGVINVITSVGHNLYLSSDYSTGTPINMLRDSSDNGYVGNRITPIAIKIRYAITLASGIGEEGHNIVSLMVIQARGAFTASIISAENQYQVVGNDTAPLSAVDENYNARYKVLNRHIVSVDTDDPVVYGTITIKGKKLRRMYFNDDGDVEANPIFLSMVSDSSVSPHPSIRAYWRLYYKNA